MYDELVKRLRKEADFPYNNNRNLMREAADAIEEMQDTVQAQDKALKQCADQLARRWIPVTEQLPEMSGVYLAWMQWDLTDPDDKPSAYPIEYDAEEEAFGWWRSYFDPESLGWAGEDFIRYEGVTHWMPLPEPPKEET